MDGYIVFPNIPNGLSCIEQLGWMEVVRETENKNLLIY